ncbi:AmmeMemoRadiSam system protein A [Methylomarinum vadi]|uniref:AmmeMemoRadiSam system protein A n=1 Tax=Methylomarinum vadi TaxID=438855 RepID=UPI0004DF494F|nr:AmmeMemoRadiSam system protein A [Methylomarinum vadi]
MSLTKDNQQILLQLARQSIENGFKTGHPLSVDLRDYPLELCKQRATFVTLEKNHNLRGCIGMLEAVFPLAEDVAENAFSAAFKDPRFPPVQKSEIDDLEIHISILSEPEPISFSSEEDLLAQIRPNVDGLILEEGHRRGTFLPSVWEMLPDKKQFLRHLKNKAGLPADYWSDTVKVYRYTTEMFG